MMRKSREDFQGALHHVMHRGARRAPIFLKDDHCYLFWELLEVEIEQLEVEIHGFSLMPNHYHLLLRSQHGNLSDAMQQVMGADTLFLFCLTRYFVLILFPSPTHILLSVRLMWATAGITLLSGLGTRWFLSAVVFS